MNPLIYFLVYLKASAFSFGGMSNFASLHKDLLGAGWAKESDFGDAAAIGQITPGPNGLWVVSLGYLSYGLLGAGLALVAVTIPPFIILPLDMIYKHLEGQRWVRVMLRSLTLVSVALMVSSVWSIMEGRVSDIWGIAICLAACLACLSKRVGSLVVVAMAAVVGYLIYGIAR